MKLWKMKKKRINMEILKEIFQGYLMMKLEKVLAKEIKLYIQHKFQIKKILLFQKKEYKR